mgnify:CR=1 FL=1
MKITLSQFLSYAAKTTTYGKLTAVQKIKENTAYEPATDYWKPIRDGLHHVLQGNMTFDNLSQVAASATQRGNKQKNYLEAVSKLESFFKNRQYVYRAAPKATWSNDDESLQVTTSPEFVLAMDGTNYLIKVFYRVKKHDERLTKWNIGSSLMLMDKATYSEQPEHSVPAILNLQTQQLVTLSDIKEPNEALLQADAAMFVTLWSRA